MVLLYVFFIVSIVFIIGLCYSLFWNGHKGIDVNIFECGIKSDIDTKEGTNYLDTFHLVYFLCIDIIFLFLLCFSIGFRDFGYGEYINLVFIIFIIGLGMVYFLRRN